MFSRSGILNIPMGTAMRLRASLRTRGTPNFSFKVCPPPISIRSLYPIFTGLRVDEAFGFSRFARCFRTIFILSIRWRLPEEKVE